jgi:hypothetical protein
MKKENIVREKTFALAIRVINLYKHLTDQKKEFVISKQLLRSGTSIGANVREADNAETKADFIHKMGVAQFIIHHSSFIIYFIPCYTVCRQRRDHKQF